MAWLVIRLMNLALPFLAYSEHILGCNSKPPYLFFTGRGLSTAASWAEIIGLITFLGAAVHSLFQIQELDFQRDCLLSRLVRR